MVIQKSAASEVPLVTTREGDSANELLKQILAQITRLADEEKIRNELILDLDGCCRFLGMKKGTVYKLTSQKKIPVTKVGKRLIFFKDELIQWLKGNRLI